MGRQLKQAAELKHNLTKITPLPEKKTEKSHHPTDTTSEQLG